MNQYNRRASTKDLSFCVVDLKAVIKKELLGKGKKYENIIQDLMKYDEENEEGLPKSVKSICEKLGISTAKYRKALEQIYSDLLEILSNEETIALQYAGTTCHLAIKGF